MIFPKEKRVESDVLVVGAGGAGCFAALRARDRGARVMMVNKVPWLGGCTIMARAAYSAAMGMSDPRDHADIHFHDSVVGGDYVPNQKVLKAMCHANVEATRDLIQWGAGFKKRPDGQLDQGSKAHAGHTYPRFVLVPEEFSHIGKMIMDVLQTQIKARKIPVLSNIMLTRLLVSNGAISGAMGFNWRDGTFFVFKAKAVIVATGGTGQLYKYTDNPTYVTGDGHAAMFQAGAEMVDMEFCDFQLGVYAPPKMFGYPPNGAMWMERGGILVNSRGERFFKKYFPHRQNEAECLRTEINKAAAWEILEGHGSPNGMVYLNCYNVSQDWMMTARQDIYAHFKRAGIDLTWQPMEIAPGNHTYLGGLRIDENAESLTIKGLYAGGETAGGWGGSNRLGGNAIAAAIGLGSQAGKSAADRAQGTSAREVDEKQVAAERKRIQGLWERRKGFRASKIKGQVKELIQKSMWLKRDEQGLKTTLAELAKMNKNELPKLCVPQGREGHRYLWLREALEAINLVLCGQMVTAAALSRKESRGSHQRTDYPETDNRKWLKNVVVWQERGKLRVRTEPVVVTEVTLPGGLEKRR